MQIRALLSIWRPVQVVSVLIYAVARFAFWKMLAADRHDASASIVFIAERYFRAAIILRGGYIKIGQLLATRFDLLPPEAIRVLSQLQEQLPALPSSKMRKLLDRKLCRQTIGSIERIEERPVATASIAQVHVAYLKSGGQKVALKIKLPDVAWKMNLDIRIAAFMARRIANFRFTKMLPVLETVDMVSHALRQQLDFAGEAKAIARFHRLFPEIGSVAFPRVYEDMSSDDIIAMDYFEDLHRFDEIAVPLEIYRQAVDSALKALFQMIFIHGYIHCDPHPGNLKYDQLGQAVFLDCGFVAELTEEDRQDFQDFFLCLVLNRGAFAAGIILKKALRTADDFDHLRFEQEVVAMFRQFSGNTAGQFQVARFVASLFELQRKFGVYSSANFTLIIIALLTFEGVVRKNWPDLDFQKIALQVVIDRNQAAARPAGPCAALSVSECDAGGVRN